MMMPELSALPVRTSGIFVDTLIITVILYLVMCRVSVVVILVYSLWPLGHEQRFALGAFRTSPAQCLYVEAYEPSLASRRPKLALNYF